MESRPEEDAQETLPLPRSGAETLAEVPTQPPEAAGAETLIEPRPTSAAPPLPARVGEFEVLSELGRGGMGLVYLARSPRLERQVALKILLAGELAAPHVRERFMVEARAAARLRHPNIVGVHEIGQDDGRRLYIAMDFIEGESLKACLQREERLEPREAARITATLGRALYYAHSHAILHRDLKPDNVLLNQDREPVLTDFGLAKEVDREGLTRSGDVMGTPAYMPPEQADGALDRIDRRADVYGLGATLYHMLCGRAPFAGPTTLAILTKVLTADPVSPRALRPELDRDLETICLKCLEKEPEDRYESALALAEELERYAANEPILARPPGRAERIEKWVRRNRSLVRGALWVAAIALGIGLIGTGVFALELSARSARLAEAQDDLGREQLETQKQRARASAEAARATTRAEEAEVARKRATRAEGQAKAEAREKEQEALRAKRLLGRALEARGLRALDQQDGTSASVWLTAALGIEDGAVRRGAARLALEQAWRRRRLRSRAWEYRAAWSADGARGVTWSHQTEAVGLLASDGRVTAELRHPGEVRHVAISRDGAQLAVVGVDGVIRLFDVATTRERWALPKRNRPITAAFSPDGRLLMTAETVPSPPQRRGAPRSKHHQVVRLWSLEGREQLAQVKTEVSVREFYASPSGEWFAWKDRKAIGLFDVRRRVALPPLRGSRGFALVGWVPGRNQLQAVAYGGRCWTWELGAKAPLAPTQVEFRSFPAGSLGVFPVASPDRRWVAVQSGPDAVVWSTATGTRTTLRGDGLNLKSLAWHPESALLAGFDGPGAVSVWHIPTGRRKVKLPALPTRTLHWLPGGQLVVNSGASAPQVWSPPPPASSLLPVAVPTTALAWSPSDKLTLGGGDGRVRLFDVGGKQVGALPGEGTQKVVALDWTADGARLAVLGSDQLTVWSQTGQRVASRKVKAGGRTVRWSPDGSRLATGHFLASADLWLGPDAKRRISLKHDPSDAAYDLAFRDLTWTPGGVLITSSSTGFYKTELIRLWDPATGRRTAVLSGPTSNVPSIRCAPDGRLLASCSIEGSVRVWNLETRAPVGAPCRRPGRRPFEVAWSGDSALLASTWDDGIVLVCDRSGKPVAQLAHPGIVLGLAWRSGSRELATAGSDSVVRVWSLRRPGGTLVHQFRGHGKRVHSVAWSPSRARLASASEDSTRSWDMAAAAAPVATLIQRAQTRTQLQVRDLALTEVEVTPRQD